METIRLGGVVGRNKPVEEVAQILLIPSPFVRDCFAGKVISIGIAFFAECFKMLSLIIDNCVCSTHPYASCTLYIN